MALTKVVVDPITRIEGHLRIEAQADGGRITLGERAKVVVFSVTEGEDKPLKYPGMFRRAGYAVLNKLDLLPHLDFSVDAALANVRQVNPALRCFLTSAATGEGLAEWLAFLRTQVRAVPVW